MNLDSVECMDVTEYLRSLPDESVNCIITSPPYYGLRNYGIDGQIGLEESPKEYLEHMVAVFAEARRVLRSDGTCWVNMGDSYNGYPGNVTRGGLLSGKNQHARQIKPSGYGLTDKHLKQKDLLMMPAELAIALRNDGYYLRSDIIWHKPNPMPESTRDRPTTAHEHVFLLTKSPRYWYDQEAIREQVAESSVQRLSQNVEDQVGSIRANGGQKTNGNMKAVGKISGRNRRDVWTIPTEASDLPHYATFPTKLIEPMILAGCPMKTCSQCGAPYQRQVEHENMVIRKTDRSALGEYGRTQSSGTMLRPASTRTIGWEPTCDCNAPIEAGIVLDFFMGSGTTALVARSLGRHFLGCDLKPEYVELARKRLAMPFTPPMF